MQLRYATTLGAALFGGFVGSVEPGSAAIIVQAGNQQYTNVNIAGATDANSITGTIGATGDTVTFGHMIGPDFTTIVEEHGNNGVAFVESFADSQPGAKDTGFSSITLTAQSGTAWTAGDFSLNQLNNNASGNVSLVFTGTGFATPFTATLPLDPNGLSQINFTTTAGEDITGLTVSVNSNTNLLHDIRQVSLNAVSNVPEPAAWSLLLAGFGALGFAMRSARKGNRVATSA
jgi:hypothetical protein